MEGIFFYIFLLLFLATLIFGFVGVFTWSRRSVPEARMLAYLMAALLIWTGGELLGLLAGDVENIILLGKIRYLGVMSAPVLWLLFVIYFSGHGVWVTWRRVGWLIVLPALGLLFNWTMEIQTWYYRSVIVSHAGPLHILALEPGWLYWVNLLYLYGLMLASLIILFRMFMVVPHAYRKRIAVVFFSALVPFLWNVLYNFDFVWQSGIDITPFFFSLAALVISWSLFHNRFSGIAPIARDLVIENMSDGMMVVDTSRRIVDINPAMVKFANLPAAELIGYPVDRVFQHRKDLVAQFQGKTKVETGFTVERDGQQIDFELRISVIFTNQKKMVGRLIELRDVSGRRAKTQELECYVQQNASLLADELEQRQLAESLLKTMMILSSSLDRNEIVIEILDQLRKVIPYHSAALYLLNGNKLQLERVVGPEKIDGKSYTTPRRQDQIQKIFHLRKAEVFISAYSNQPNERGDPVYSSMAAPLVVGQEALGVLTIDRFESVPFTQENAEILQAFTNQAAIAIKNAEYYQQAAQTAILEERNRLAQELHDAVNQTLFTASIMAEALPQIWERNPEQGKQGLLEIRQLTRAALSEMRTLLMELHPQRITEKTLGTLLDHLTHSVSNRLRIPIELEVVQDVILMAEVQLAFYRIAQESLNNIMKHASATQAWVVLDAQANRASLLVRDDGEGFEMGNSQPENMGLGIMRARAEKIGAQFNIQSQLNHGTEIRLTWENGEAGLDE